MANATKLPSASVKTPICDLNYMFISGKGAKKNAKSKDTDPNVFRGTAVIDANSPKLKPMLDALSDLWEQAKAVDPKIKGKFKLSKAYKGKLFRTSAIRVISEKTDEIDPDTEEPVYADTGKIGITAYTNTEYKGKPNKVKIYAVSAKDAKSAKELGTKANFTDQTDAFHNSGASIGDGSRGILHMNAMVYEYEGNYGILLFLKAVQLVEFVPYAGSQVELEEIEEETYGIDFGSTSNDTTDDEESDTTEGGENAPNI